MQGDRSNFFWQQFCCSFQEGRVGVRLGFFLAGPFLRHVSKGMRGCDCWLFGQSLVCQFLENSTLAFFVLFDSILDSAHQRETLDASFGGALRFGGVAFPVHRASQLI